MDRVFRITLLVTVVGLSVSLTLGAAAPATITISIKGMKFNPGDITIAVGDTLRWTNEDDRDHTVTAADGSFRSGNLRSGDTFEHTFDKAGKFAYSCSYHPRMKGSVDVTE